MLFSNMTLNPQPLHIDRHFCETETEWGQPLMNSLFTLGLMIGIQVSDMTVGTTIANLGMQDVKFGHPLFEGDTVHCTTEVIGKRESKSRPGAGIVEFHHRAYNQDNKLVAECQRQAFIKMQPKSASTHTSGRGYRSCSGHCSRPSACCSRSPRRPRRRIIRPGRSGSSFRSLPAAASTSSRVSSPPSLASGSASR